MENKKSLVSRVFAPIGNFFEKLKPDPLTAKRFERFMEIKRAKYSLIIVVALYLFSLFAELFISNRAVVMMVDGTLYFPTYSKMRYAEDFNFKVSDELELDYRAFAKYLRETKRGWAILPILPFNPYETDDSADYPLAMTFKSAPILGFAISDVNDKPGNDASKYNWIPSGQYDGYKLGDTYIWFRFANGPNAEKIVNMPSKANNWIGIATDKATKQESELARDYIWHEIGKNKNEIPLGNGKMMTIRYSMSRNGDMYHPLPPSLSRRHILGTDKIGRDVFARIIYGFRIAMSFSLLVAFVTYFIGTIVGIAMGYFGGLFDMLSQRFIEVWERIPYLYMIMILSSIFNPNFLMFVLINIAFDWSGKTWTMRAMTYRERERDYVLAAKSMGASVWRIITVHILPNVMVLIVTSLPFVISGGIGTLTSLDYLGYGLQPPTPSWGEILSMGTQTYQSAPWILSSGVTAFVLVLVMVAFIGEGLREAFDPRKYTVYR